MTDTLLQTLQNILLWDRCEMPNCNRHGFRGEEVIVDGRAMCRGCAVIWRKRIAIADAVIAAGANRIGNPQPR